jgi:hypothetical protein
VHDKGELRTQFHHVIDVAPTILELAGLPQPLMVNGVMQRPIEGVSMAYSFNDAAAAERHETQYFEMFGNRGIYHKGWTAVTKHRTPWETGQTTAIAFDDDNWELYDTSKDWSQARDLSKQQPDLLKKLQQLWLIEAVKYNVLPLDDRFAERGNAEIAGRPELIAGNRQIVFGAVARVPALAMITLQNKSHAITADLQVPEAGAEGVITAMGGTTGGWSLYVKNGKPKYCYNFFGLQGRCIGSSLTLALRLTITIISSRPRSVSGWPWRSSRGCAGASVVKAVRVRESQGLLGARCATGRSLERLAVIGVADVTSDYTKLMERMLHRRAVEAVIWGMPAANYDLMYQAMVREAGGSFNQVFVPYTNTAQTGPLVLQIPPAGPTSSRTAPYRTI